MHKFTNFSIIVIAVMIIILVIQNFIPATFRVFFWNIEGTLSAILIIVLLTGIVLGYFLSLRSIFKKRKQIKELEKRLKLMEQKENAGIPKRNHFTT